jgi:phosphoserine phosphatase
MKTLILLDLDHTLIYGSFAPSESAPLLFEYSQYLKVYERPYARQFIHHLQELGDTDYLARQEQKESNSVGFSGVA